MCKKISYKCDDFQFNMEGYTIKDVEYFFSLITSHTKINNDKHTIIKKNVLNDNLNAEDTTIKIKDVMKNVKLPIITTDCMCTKCKQSLLFMDVKRNIIIIRNLKDDKLYEVDTSIDKMPDNIYVDGKLNYDIVIDIYNDLIKHITNKPISLISDSADIIKCLFCNEEIKIEDAVKMFDFYKKNNICPICGGKTESILTQDGEKMVCKEHDCLKKIF